MRELGEEAEQDVRLYFTGGATAVLLGWRPGTIDVDNQAGARDRQDFRALPRLKEKLEINIELASPDQFIPELPGWRARSAFIARRGAACHTITMISTPRPCRKYSAAIVRTVTTSDR